MIALTYFQSLRIAHGKRVRTTWPALVERLAVPRFSADKHDVPGLSLATYANDYRLLANVEQVFAVGLDLDERVNWDDLTVRFESCAAFLHTTWSSTEAEPRARVFLPLSRPVTADEYRRVYAGIAAHIEEGGLVVDRQASDPSRFWFLPAAQPGATYHYSVGRGAPINVEGVLAKVPPPAPLPPLPVRPRTPYGGASAVDRARKYLASCPPAIEGSGGENTTLVTAMRLVRGFALSVDETYALLANDWNPRCSPPWDERRLRRKIEQALTQGRMAMGDLLERDR
jgi:hypothetical protein